jgi:hypothetical protein
MRDLEFQELAVQAAVTGGTTISVSGLYLPRHDETWPRRPIFPICPPVHPPVSPPVHPPRPIDCFPIHPPKGRPWDCILTAGPHLNMAS